MILLHIIKKIIRVLTEHKLFQALLAMLDQAQKPI